MVLTIKLSKRIHENTQPENQVAVGGVNNRRPRRNTYTEARAGTESTRTIAAIDRQGETPRPRRTEPKQKLLILDSRLRI